MEKNNFRIGILGGMGPMTGVFLQKLIIENTPAKIDQDHIEVICFTNPQIPDRTKSLKEDNGKVFVKSIVESIKVLEKSDVNCILLPCNTAHARYSEIQNSTYIPIINMVELVLSNVRKTGVKNIGVLATDGTIDSGIFETDKSFRVILPNNDMQSNVMNTIYKIKSGEYDNIEIAEIINTFINDLEKRGAEKIILGCTELSLYLSLLKNKNLIDPLIELAKETVKIATNKFDKSKIFVENKLIIR
mgnify:CR=1 FL=1